MTAVEYLSGDRWLVAGPTSVVQLAGEPSDALRWWPAVRAGAGAGELIGHLYADGVLGTGTALAIVCIEPSTGDRATPAVRVLAQGSATVVVETVTGEKVPVSGAGLLSWSEVLVEGAAAVYLECPTTLPAAGDLLPMPAGVVRAGAVRWQLTDRRSGGSGAVPEMSGAKPRPAPGVPARQVPVGADDATGDDPNAEGFAGGTGMTPPASALAALAAGSSTAVQDAEVTQSVPDPDDQDIGQGDSGDADPTEEDDDAGAPGSEQPPPVDGGAGDAADRNAPGRIDDHRGGAAPAATASGRPAVQASSGRLSPDNPFPPVVVPPFSPPPLPPQVEPPPLTPPPPFVPAATSLPAIIGGPGRNDPGLPTRTAPRTRAAPVTTTAIPSWRRTCRPATDRRPCRPLRRRGRSTPRCALPVIPMHRTPATAGSAVCPSRRQSRCSPDGRCSPGSGCRPEPWWTSIAGW